MTRHIHRRECLPYTTLLSVMMPHRKYGSQDTRNIVTVVNRTHLEVGKGQVQSLKQGRRRHLWLFTLCEVTAGVSRHTRPVLRAEVGVQERKAWSDTSLAWMDLFTCSVWCVVSDPLSGGVHLLDGAVVAGGHQVEVQLARHQHAAGGQVQQPQPQPGGRQLPC